MDDDIPVIPVDEIEGAITISKGGLEKVLIQWKKKIAEPEKWDDFVDRVYDAAHTYLWFEAQIQSARGDEASVKQQIDAVNAIRRNLEKLNAVTIDEIWEIFVEDESPCSFMENVRAERKAMHEQFMAQCQCWVEVYGGDKRNRVNVWKKLLVKELLAIFSQYTSTKLEDLNITDFSCFCYNIFRCCYRERCTEETLGEWARERGCFFHC